MIFLAHEVPWDINLLNHEYTTANFRELDMVIQ